MLLAHTMLLIHPLVQKSSITGRAMNRLIVYVILSQTMILIGFISLELSTTTMAPF
jgi:hypothetical protein